MVRNMESGVDCLGSKRAPQIQSYLLEQINLSSFPFLTWKIITIMLGIESEKMNIGLLPECLAYGDFSINATYSCVLKYA